MMSMRGLAPIYKGYQHVVHSRFEKLGLGEEAGFEMGWPATRNHELRPEEMVEL